MDAIAAPPRPRLHAPGVYFDLPMEDYVNDPAISGSSLKKLLTSPADFKWELPALKNPLFEQPASDARALGTLVHCAVLEGMDAFAHRFCVLPEFDDEDPRLIRTADQAKNWLKDNDCKVSGLKAELFQRVRERWAQLQQLEQRADDEGPIFIDDVIADLVARGNGNRTPIKPRAWAYVQQVEAFVRSWPQASALLRDGLAEVSVFWIEDGVRYKARFDYIQPRAIVDAKKFGQPPRRNQSLRTYLAREAASYCYDIQAVHNSRAALQLPLLRDIIGGTPAQADQLRAIAQAYLMEPPEFFWLWLRTPGPPQGHIMRFPADAKRWHHCELDIRDAIEKLQAYRETCGDELDPESPWVETGVEDWDDDDLPAYMWEGEG